jgi:hypothetical protein
MRAGNASHWLMQVAIAAVFADDLQQAVGILAPVEADAHSLQP